MSDDDDFLTGRENNEAVAGYSPMPSATPKEPEEEPDYYPSSRDGLLDATDDLIKSRGQKNEPDVIDRSYVSIGGPDEGEPRPATETITAERAADDLARARAAQVDAMAAESDAQLRAAVDSAKGIATEAEIEAWQQSQLQQKEQQWQQAQQQPQAEAPPPGVDKELYELLRNNPKVSAALQAEVAQVTRAQAQFAEASMQNAKLAMASLVASEPLLQGIEPSQVATALTLIERQDPARAVAVRQHLERVQQLYNVSQQARAEQQKLADQQSIAQWKSWEAQESAKWDRFAAQPENAQRVKAVMPEAVSLFAEYGLGREQLQHLLKTQPLLNSEIGQRIVLDALSYRQAQRSAFRSAPKPVPAVQRPGTAPARYTGSDGEAEAAASEFNRNTNIRTAARMIAAQRRANSR